MNYQTFRPRPELESLVKCFWTLEVPAGPDPQRQRIIPDGCIEMIFVLGDDIKRFTPGGGFIIQPRAMVLGQITRPFYVEPMGHVDSFAVRFYPYGFSGFANQPIKGLADKESPLGDVFGEKPAKELERRIIRAADTGKRVEIAEKFLLDRLGDKNVSDRIVRSAIDALLSTKGGASISAILKDDPSKRRRLERKFSDQVGLSPKQLGKVIRMQAALKMLLDRKTGSLTRIAYESEYYDQAHFTKDFKEFTGASPKDFLGNAHMALSALFYGRN